LRHCSATGPREFRARGEPRTRGALACRHTHPIKQTRRYARQTSDALESECRHQPVEQVRRIARPYGRCDPGFAHVDAQIADFAKLSCMSEYQAAINEAVQQLVAYFTQHDGAEGLAIGIAAMIKAVGLEQGYDEDHCIRIEFPRAVRSEIVTKVTKQAWRVLRANILQYRNIYLKCR
jgi:hypothetical protein